MIAILSAMIAGSSSRCGARRLFLMIPAHISTRANSSLALVGEGGALARDTPSPALQAAPPWGGGGGRLLESRLVARTLGRHTLPEKTVKRLSVVSTAFGAGA